MSREVRMVPPDWAHPKYTEDNAPFPQAVGRYIPMLDRSHAEAVEEWETDWLPKWIEGERLWREQGKVICHGGAVETIAQVVADARAHCSYRHVDDSPEYEWWAGECPSRPRRRDYMPDWPIEQRTHLMMYESTSEGTPISPAFATPEELARWLADNGASAFGRDTATYEQWLAMARQGWSVSGVMIDGRMMSGVEFAAKP